MRSRRFLAVLAILGIVLAVAACLPANTPTPALTPVTLQLKSLPAAQFAGFYAAAQNGYYRDEGLDVTLLPGSVEIDVLQTVLGGKAQFGEAGAIGARPERVVETNETV